MLEASEGDSPCLLGNEAIVRAALEAGVGFASGYPGTPSSEITDTFHSIADTAGLVFEYSVNEKIALEMAFAASLANTRSIVSMKHLGLMSAGDPLSTIPYIGVEAGMVIVSAGDPSCRTSPNEQDQRLLGPMLHLPVLDPSTPAEAYEMTRFAFELSEECRLPVLLRVTTRVCHSRAPVTCGSRRAPQVGGFEKSPGRYVPMPRNARRMRLEIHERMARARELIDASEPLRREGNGKLAVIAAGAPAATCADVLRFTGLGDDVSLFRLCAVYPLPEDALVEALQGVERALVLEELSPFVEDALRSLCALRGLQIEILGKRTGHLPVEFEYEPPIIESALRSVLGVADAPPSPRRLVDERLGAEQLLRAEEPAGAPPVRAEGAAVVPRPPSLCPGCPHRTAFFAVRAAFDEDQLYFNDIGCYTLGVTAPLNVGDAVLCMGAGFTLAAGVAQVTGKRTVGFMGDGTFFHSGMPALLNAIKERVNMVAVILDNQVTAMTGFQESPTTPDISPASIEAVVRAFGPTHVEKVDPQDLAEATAAFRRARDAEGVSVVIVERACPVWLVRRPAPEKRLPVLDAASAVLGAPVEAS